MRPVGFQLSLNPRFIREQAINEQLRGRPFRLLGFEFEFLFRRQAKASALFNHSNVQYKLPRSVQVVIFAGTSAKRHYLLLQRVASHGGFWQSVTGSLEEGETHRQAAAREVLEETGFVAHEEALIELGVVNTFLIAPQWRAKYAPGVTHNEEVCFALKVEQREAQLDPIEHVAYVWESYDRAVEMLYWESTKRAFAAMQLIR
jgi:dihydroneopterin triphosphate diphosphatase